MSWVKLIIFAVITGVYTGLINQISFLHNTSFSDIAVSFECWIFFGTVIIMNSKSNIDSALKCFVFFLVSQPLVYLTEVPFIGWYVMEKLDSLDFAHPAYGIYRILSQERKMVGDFYSCSGISVSRLALFRISGHDDIFISTASADLYNLYCKYVYIFSFHTQRKSKNRRHYY